MSWAERLADFVPGFLAGHPVIGPLADRGDVVLHGSTTRGVDDASSDIDLWWLLDDLEAVDELSDTRFFDLGSSLGKPGHLNAESIDAFRQGVDRIDLELIFELRTSVVIRGERAPLLIERARTPMPDDVRRAAVFYHYVEMRSFHRSCDTPMDRGETMPVLLALAPTLAHAFRTALVLQGLPYPYGKWLWTETRSTPVGSRIEPHVNAIMASLTPDVLTIASEDNPITRDLRAIRAILVEEARATGIDEPWLDRWWLSMTDSRTALDRARWP